MKTPNKYYENKKRNTYYVYEENNVTVIVPYISESLVKIMASDEIVAGSIKTISANNKVEALLKAGISEEQVIYLLIEALKSSSIQALVEFDLIETEFF